MALPTSSSAPEPTQLPGDFRRHPGTGAPYVRSVTNTRKRQGKKSDLLAAAEREGVEVDPKWTVAQLHEALGPEPAFEQFGRPSSLGKQIENMTNLQKWSERAVALGVMLDGLDVVKGQELLAELVDLGPDHWTLDDPDARPLLDAIAVKAKNLAQAGIAAERGTHTHALTEDADNERDWIERARSGEDLGIPVPAQSALVAAWEAMLDAEGIEILAVETAVVDDVWRQAGTLDRIARLTRERKFILPGGEIVTLPAGWVGVLDVKTGRLRAGRDQHPDYWHGYAVQIASYAQAVPYDVDTDTRGEWPFEIDQDYGIIAHLDVAAAIEGTAKCRLVLVDLEMGRQAGELCVAAREWEKCRHVFSAVDEQLGSYEVAVEVPPTSQQAAVENEGDNAVAAVPQTPAAEVAGPNQQAAGSVDEDHGPSHDAPAAENAAEEDPQSPPDASSAAPTRRDQLRERRIRMEANASDTGWHAEFLAKWKAFGISPNSTDDEIAAALDAIEPPFEPDPAPPHGIERPALPEPAPRPDNGARLDDATLTTLIETIKGSDHRAVVNGWLAQSADAGHSWSPRLHPWERHFEISRAALALAKATDGDDEYARFLLGHVLPGAEQPTFAVGVTLGVLTIADARRVTALAEAFGDPLALLFHDDGTPYLVGDVAAVLAAA